MPFEPLRELGKLLLVFGLVLVLVGTLLTLWPPEASGRGLGRLPGDIVLRRENFTLYFPLVTCLLVSGVLTLVLWLLGRR